MLTSVKIFLIAIAVVGLQLIPQVGIFLMVLGAIGWSALLVNLGFAQLLREVLQKRAPRWAIGFPIAWFGGYALAAVLSNIQASKFIRQIDAQNDQQFALFDPKTSDLLIKRGATLSAGDLVDKYSLEKAYFEFNEGGQIITGAEWMVRSSCPGTGQIGVSHYSSGFADNVSWRRMSTGGYGRNEPSRIVQSLCRYSGHRKPEKAVTTVKTSKPIETSGLLETSSQIVTITPPSGGKVQLRSGTAEPLPWFPLLIAGCFLNSARAKWECEFGFARWASFQSEEYVTREIEVVAKALRLAEREI